MDKPLVSYFLMTYKHEEYIEEALKSALAQTYAPLEIIISDDGSPDGTFQIIKKVLKHYHGEHKIIVNKNDGTLGLAPHINKLASLAQGEFFIAAAGDDVAHADRTIKLVEAMLKQKAYAVHTNADVVNASGEGLAKLFTRELDIVGDNWMGIIDKGIARVSGSSLGMRRDVYDVFGPLPEYLPCEDQVLAFRSALLGGFGYLDESLLQYRTHASNLSNWASSLNAKTNDELLAIKYQQAKKRVAEKKAMLYDIKTLIERKQEFSRYLNDGANKLSHVLALESFNLSMLSPNRPNILKRCTAFLCLVSHIGFRTLSLKRITRALGLAISVQLYIQNQKLNKRSLSNRTGLDG